MLGDYKINRTTRRCDVQNRPLEPGEFYYSVVTEQDEDLSRIDISADAWKGPPEGCIGHWKNRVPIPGEKARELAPPAVLIELLRSLADQPTKTKSRYLLALLLLRKRHLQLSSATPMRPEEANPPEAEPESLSVEIPATKEILEIPVCGIDSEEANSLQAELIDLIYREAE